MSEPTCRSCWLSSLPKSERERMASEAITSCVYLCPDHQAAMDAIFRDLPPLPLIKASTLRTERDFFRAIDMDAAADHCEQAAMGYEGGAA